MNRLLLAATVLALGACSPSAEQLKKVMEENPQILTNAIEKNGTAIIESLNKAAMDARQHQAENQETERNKALEDEFKNPKKPEVPEGKAVWGKADAPILIVEYSDFECPYCGRGYETLNQVKKKYGDKVKILFKNLPLDFHPMALPAAKYFEAVAMQDAEKALKFHNMVFENQEKMKEKKEAYLKDVAKKVGADMKRLAADVNSPKVMSRIEADKKEAAGFGFQGTPGYLINGVSIRGAYPISEFEKIIDRLLGENKG